MADTRRPERFDRVERGLDILDRERDVGGAGTKRRRLERRSPALRRVERNQLEHVVAEGRTKLREVAGEAFDAGHVRNLVGHASLLEGHFVSESITVERDGCVKVADRE